MSPQWMLYALAVGALVTLAALAAEQSTRLARRAGRGVWVLAMVSTVAVPLFALFGTLNQTVVALPVDHANGGALAGAVFKASVLAAPPISAAAWTPPPAVQAAGIDLDSAVRSAWLMLSLTTGAALALSALSLRRRRRAWKEDAIAGQPVLVACDAGPAVVGVLRPRIVVPQWLLAAPASHQALVLAHEQSHIAAGDQRLLGCCWMLLVAMPWNLPLWYQLRRLRRAIEVDCDARVLDRGHPLRDYGAALIEVGARPAAMPAFTTAMAESAGFLEQRLRLMTRRPARWHRLAAPLLLLLSIDVGVAAARIAPPSATVSVPAAQRQQLAGYYQVGEHRVAVVTVTGQGLSMKTNLEPAMPLLPASEDRYFVPGTDLQIQFDRATHTLSTLHMNMPVDTSPRVDSAAVEQADAWVASRVASGAALPGGEAIVRRNIGATTFEQLTAGDFTPGFLRLAEPLMPMQKARLAEWGEVVDVAFDGVNRWGWDRYKVRYGNKTVVWAIWLDADGKLENATPQRPD